MRQYLAIDIGASSGRHIVGWQEDGEICTVEVFRFPNGMEEADGHLVWNLDALTDSIREGIGLAKQFFPGIVSLSVDTWGVDYVLMKGDREILPCYAYRDSRTGPAIPEVHRRMPFEELYRRTGIQHQPFNTIYQLYADRMAGRLEEADSFLPMPSYLMYRLCGVKAHEFTEATTGGMVSAATGEYDPLRDARHGKRGGSNSHGRKRVVSFLRNLEPAGNEDTLPADRQEKHGGSLFK